MAARREKDESNGRSGAFCPPSSRCPHPGALSINAKPRAQSAGLYWTATCRGFISSRYRDACRPRCAGFRVRLSEVSAIGPISSSRLCAPRPVFSKASVPRPGTTLKQVVEGGRRRSASGTPPRGRAQQRNTGQQPDQALVRESIPNRGTVAAPVDAFPGVASRASATNCAPI